MLFCALITLWLPEKKHLVRNNNFTLIITTHQKIFKAHEQLCHCTLKSSLLGKDIVHFNKNLVRTKQKIQVQTKQMFSE